MRTTRSVMKRRLVLLLFVLLAAVGALIVRLLVVQGIMAPWLGYKLKEQVNRQVPVEAVRGTIYDAKLDPLVYTATAASILAVPAQIKDKSATATALAPILNMSSDNILRSLQKKNKYMVYLSPGGRRMTDQQTQAVRALHLPGIYISEEGKRAYPFGTLAAQVLGITGSDSQGLTGIEKQDNQVLAGEEGYIAFDANAKGEKLSNTGETYVPPQPGEDIQLTLDAQIQQFVEREIEQAVATYNPDHVTAIVANPKTGAILAMANYPTFDPAHWQDYPASTYDRNLAIWQTFEPGSTFKIVTLSAALQENKVNLNDRFYDPGYYEVAGRKIRCWKAGGHGSESFLNVVENSCNPGFIALGERLGKENLFSYIRKFGFGSKTGIDLPGEGNGILFNLKRVGPLELATTAFGQGVSVTPIQQVMAMSAIANGGKLMKPYVVQDYRDHDTSEVTYEAKPTEVRQVITPAVAAQVRAALESVVAQGTGGNAYVDGYRVAGKTGTAQVVENGRYATGHYIVSFIGMAPANDPQLVAYIAIDHPRPRDNVVFGGTIAAPIVGRILADSLAYEGVPRSDGGIAKKVRWGDTVYTQVPNFVGMTLGDAQRYAIQTGTQLKVEIVGLGKYIISQSPPQGTKVPELSTVRLYLGSTAPPSSSH